MEPDFSRYSLALIHEGEMVHSSTRKGLRPLHECIKEHDKLRGCELHDKIIGLAAARLIVDSQMIDAVKTTTASEPAQGLLKDYGIKIEAKKTVKNILTKDKDDICPMEKLAMQIDDNARFAAELGKRMG